MTSRLSYRPLVVGLATAILSVTLASAELFGQPPAPAQPATPPAQPGTPSPAPAPITPAQPATPTPSTPAPPTTAPPSPTTPATPSEPSPGTATTPAGVPRAPGTGATPRVVTNEVPPPGQIGPPVTLTGCVKRVERLDTDSATVADVINRPMTAYVLEPVGAKADAQPRVTGLIAANQGIRLEDRIGKPVEVSGTLRPPMVIGSPQKDADTLAVNELQPMIVRAPKPASVQCK